MPNKFQKSVLERLEQEAVRQKQKTPVKKEKNVKDSVKIEARKDTKEIKVNVEPNPEQIVIPLPAPDIGDYLRRDNQRLAKNKTFYLDSDVIDAIKSTAKAQSVTDSKLVNDIMRHVLGLQ